MQRRPTIETDVTRSQGLLPGLVADPFPAQQPGDPLRRRARRPIGPLGRGDASDWPVNGVPLPGIRIV